MFQSYYITMTSRPKVFANMVFTLFETVLKKLYREEKMKNTRKKNIGTKNIETKKVAKKRITAKKTNTKKTATKVSTRKITTRKNKSEEITDVELLNKFQKGCNSSYEQLVRKYQAKVHSLALRLTKNTEDAEEVLQDVFITIYKKAASFQGKAKFSSWLYRITCNASFMKLRKNKQEQAIAVEDLSPYLHEKTINGDLKLGNRGDEVSMNKQIKVTLESAISKLPEEYRAVFILRDIDGLSNKEVGNILNLSVPAVKSRLHRSRLMLRKKLQRFYNEHTQDERKMSKVHNKVQRAA